MKIHRWIVPLICAAMALGVGGCKKSDEKKGDGSGAGGAGAGGKPIVAYVTNNASPFWNIAEAGVRKAEQEFGVKAEVHKPSPAQSQQSIIDTLIARKVSGIAISPVDSANQVDLLNRIRDAGIHLICHDSDAAASKRQYYVGTNNVDAGRAAGQLIKEALGEKGGKIMLFVGSIDAQNARERKQGIEEELKGTNIQILGVLTDGEDRARCKSNAEDTMIKHPDVACLVGLWSYNSPQILRAVEGAGNLGKVKIVAFDEEDETLEGVEKGHIYATVVQQPFEFGYRSIKYLAALASDKKDLLPAGPIDIVPVQKINKENVEAFKAKLKEQRGG